MPINGQRRTAVDEAADEAENEHCFADEDENEDKSRPRFEVAERRPAQQNAHRRGHKGGGAGDQRGGAARLPVLRLDVLRLVDNVAKDAEEAEGVGEETAHHQRIGDDALEGAQASCYQEKTNLVLE